MTDPKPLRVLVTETGEEFEAIVTTDDQGIPNVVGGWIPADPPQT
jgi:hypothetical protein